MKRQARYFIQWGEANRKTYSGEQNTYILTYERPKKNIYESIIYGRWGTMRNFLCILYICM